MKLCMILVTALLPIVASTDASSRLVQVLSAPALTARAPMLQVIPRWGAFAYPTVGGTDTVSPPQKSIAKSKDPTTATAMVLGNGNVVVSGVAKGNTVITLTFPDGSIGKIFVFVK